MWVLIVSSSMLLFNLEYTTEEKCLYYAERILSIDRGLRDSNRKPLTTTCVKKVTENSVK